MSIPEFLKKKGKRRKRKEKEKEKEKNKNKKKKKKEKRGPTGCTLLPRRPQKLRSDKRAFCKNRNEIDAKKNRTSEDKEKARKRQKEKKEGKKNRRKRKKKKKKDKQKEKKKIKCVESIPAQVNSGCAVDRRSQRAAWCPGRLVSVLMILDT